MHYKITVSRAMFMSFAVVLLVLISLVCLAPLWHVLMGSLSNPTQVGHYSRSDSLSLAKLGYPCL